MLVEYVGFLALNFNIYYELNKKLTYTSCYLLVKKIIKQMSIITKFKSFFDDKNVNKYHWFNDEYQYLINMDFIFSEMKIKK